MPSHIVSLLFWLNIALAAATMLLLWRRDKLRGMWEFHVAALAAGVVLYAVMIWLSSLWEVDGDKTSFRFGVRAFLGAVVWIPFMIFLAIVWGRVLGQLASSSDTSLIDEKLKDAAVNLEFGHETRAAKILLGALDIDPGNVEAHAMMGEVHLQRGKYEKAVGSFRLAMGNARDNKEFAKFVFKTAVILNEHLGNPKAAVRELDLIRKRMPDTPEAVKAQDWIVKMMDEAARE